VVRGVSRSEVAQRIAETLRAGDTPLARELIEAGAQLFGRTAMVTDVGLASHRLEQEALQRASGQPRVNGHHHPAGGAHGPGDEGWPADYGWDEDL
jgi:hypothetical protein